MKGQESRWKSPPQKGGRTYVGIRGELDSQLGAGLELGLVFRAEAAHDLHHVGVALGLGRGLAIASRRGGSGRFIDLGVAGASLAHERGLLEAQVGLEALDLGINVCHARARARSVVIGDAIDCVISNRFGGFCDGLCK